MLSTVAYNVIYGHGGDEGIIRTAEYFQKQERIDAASGGLSNKFINEITTGAKHFDWWVFPYNWGSYGKGSTYQVNPSSIAELKSENRFTENYHYMIKRYFWALGWDIENSTKIGGSAFPIKPYYPIRFAKCFQSLKEFGETKYLESAKEFLKQHPEFLSELQSKESWCLAGTEFDSRTAAAASKSTPAAASKPAAAAAASGSASKSTPAAASGSAYQSELDVYNRVYDHSNLTYQNVNSLMRSAFIKAGAEESWYDEFNEKAFGVCPIGEGGTALRNFILNFIASGINRASIALCRGRLVNGEIRGDTHWTALHFRKQGNDIIPYYFDSGGGDFVPADVENAINRVRNLKATDLTGDDSRNALFQRAVGQIASLRFQEVKKVPCENQRDGYSCGYHAVFNSVGAFREKDPEKSFSTIWQNPSHVNRTQFIENSKIELRREFNGTDHVVASPSKALGVSSIEVTTNDKFTKAVVGIIAATESAEEYLERINKIKAIHTAENKLSDDDKIRLMDIATQSYKKILNDLVEARRSTAIEPINQHTEFLLNILNSNLVANKMEEEKVIAFLDKIVTNKDLNANAASLIGEARQLELVSETSKLTLTPSTGRGFAAGKTSGTAPSLSSRVTGNGAVLLSKGIDTTKPSAEKSFADKVLEAISDLPTSETWNGKRFKLGKDNYCINPTHGTLYKNHKYVGDSKELQKELKHIQEAFMARNSSSVSSVTAALPSSSAVPLDAKQSSTRLATAASNGNFK